MSALVHYVWRRSAATSAKDSRDSNDGDASRHLRYRFRQAPVLVVREAPAEPESVADWKLVHERIVALGAERAALMLA